MTRCCAGKQNKMLGILVTGVAPDFLGCCSFIRVARSSRFGDHWRFAVWGASTTAPKWIIWQIRKSPHQSSPDFWVDFRVIMGHQLPKLNNGLPQGCDCMPSHFFRYQVSQSCNLVPLVPIHAHLVCYVCCNLTLVLVKDWCATMCVVCGRPLQSFHRAPRWHCQPAQQRPRKSRSWKGKTGKTIEDEQKMNCS